MYKKEDSGEEETNAAHHDVSNSLFQILRKLIIMKRVLEVNNEHNNINIKNKRHLPILILNKIIMCAYLDMYLP